MGPEYFWGSGMWIFPLTMLVEVFLLFGRGGIGPGCAPWSGHHRRRDPQERPLEILKSRYARGEISREEFEDDLTES